ncbi:MAG: hemin uptake protein HemP [Planctomycetota bacterium]
MNLQPQSDTPDRQESLDDNVFESLEIPATPPILDFNELTKGNGQEVWIRLDNENIYRLQKTKHGKLLLSK